ncbi:MAG: hypothetical protein LBH28_09330, partial [Oscillospiraceae bacterium]|nr:hypothetical protein [Oscillospiraceae bacterium]
TPVFWRIFRHASLNFLEIKQLFLRKFALPDKKFAQNPCISTFDPGSRLQGQKSLTHKPLPFRFSPAKYHHIVGDFDARTRPNA